MTNYNDGNWHGWNGGECPVHPETVVEIMIHGGRRAIGMAAIKDWTHDEPHHRGDIIAFRVVKVHREPRDFWLNTEIGIWTTFKPSGYPEGEIIHVREVLE